MRSAGLKQHGYIMLPVMLTVALVATIAFMMNHESSMGSKSISNELEAAQARFVAEAGLRHAQWQVKQAGCGPYTDISGQTFGNHSYSATITPNNAGGQITSYSVPVSDDAWIKSDTPTQNYGNDAQLSTFFRFMPSSTQRTLYRFDIASAGIAPGALVVSAVAKLFVVDSNDSAPVTAHQVTADWTESTVNWDNINASHDSSTLASIPTGSPVGEYVSVNITSLVQGWINGTTANQGIMLKTTWINDLAQFTSKEYGNTSQHPLLEIKISDGTLSNRASIAAQGTLTNGVARGMTREDLVLYQAALNTLELQPDATEGRDTFLDQLFNSNPNGASTSLTIRDESGFNAMRPLLSFDLSLIPAGAHIQAASLGLYLEQSSGDPFSVDVHRVSASWLEDSASWDERQSGTAWSTAGGDFDPVPVTTGVVGPATDLFYALDVTNLVEGWVTDMHANDGLILVVPQGTLQNGFASSDSATAANRPKLTVTYTCECGVACIAPQGSGKVLLVVGDALNVDPGDAYKRSLFEDWGYMVSLIDDDSDQPTIDAALANNDVAYISETVSDWTLGDKLAATTKGVLNEKGGQNDNLAIAPGSTNSVGRSLSVIDSSHYITELLPLGALPIYSADMDGLSVSGTLAPGLQTLADWGGQGSLVVLDVGAEVYQGATYNGDGTATGRRVSLPIGRNSAFNWEYLNNNGRLLVQRAIQWGSEGIGSCSNPQTLEISVIASHDDGEEPLSADQPVLASDDLELGNTSDGDQVVGMRFQNVTISRGSEIIEAYIDFTVDETTSGDTNLIIKGEASDNAAEFAWTYHNIIDRPTTSALTPWSDVPPWNSVGEVHSTPDVAAAVQEIVDRPGWSSGNALAIIISGTGRRIPESYDGLPSGAPKLRVTFCPSGASPSVIYWTDDLANKIQRSDEDGSNIEDVLTGLNAPTGLAIDTSAGKLYWTNGSGQIKRSNLDGTDIEVVFTDLSAVFDVKLDTTAGKVYWNNLTFNDISRTNLDGSGREIVLTASGRPAYLSLDTGAGQIYFPDYDGGAVSRGNFDGSGYVQLVTGQGNPIGSALDLAAGKIYWSDGAVGDSIRRANLDGSGVEVVVSGLLAPQDLAVDSANGKLYWAAADASKIQRASLDGTTIEDVAIGLNRPRGIVVVDAALVPPVAGGGSGPVVEPCNGAFRDEFNNPVYSGNDGSLSWTGDWQEINESDGPTDGDEQVFADLYEIPEMPTYQLFVRDNDSGGEGVMRALDLSGAQTATLSFDYKPYGLDKSTDYASVQMSTTGTSGPWSEVVRFAGPVSEDAYKPYSTDISAYISDNAVLRIITSKFMGPSDYLWLDNIQIQCSP